MTSGVLAAPARAVTALGRGAARPGVGWSAVRVLAAAALTVVAGLLPGPVAQTALMGLTFGTVVWVGVWLLTAAPRTDHPRGWWWYGASVLVGGAGSAAATLVVPVGETALGSVPGQLIGVVALVHMLDRRSLRGSRAQLTTLLVLFVLADLLTVHTVFYATLGIRGVLTTAQTVSLFGLLLALALATGVALVKLSVSRPHERRSGWLVLGAQWATTLASMLSAITTVDGGLLQAGACGASVLGLGLLVTACRADLPRPSARGESSGTAASALGALLPHGMAMLGGSLLLVSAAVTGTITVFGTTLAVLGLCTLLVHQVFSWLAERRLTSQLQSSEAYFRTLVRGSADPILILDDQLRVTWVSPAITELLGLDPQAIVGLSVADAVHPDDAAGILAALSSPQAQDDEEAKTRTARIRHADGRWRLIQARVRDLRRDPDVGALVLYCRDVTRDEPGPVTDGDLTSLSTTDPTTGLPSRSALSQRLAAALRDDETASRALVVLGIGGLGPDDDVEVLRELTTRFARALRGDDWLARAGAGEFAVLVEGTVSDAEVVAARLVAAVGPVPTLASTARLTAWAGVATLVPGLDAGEALRRGDLALRSARAAGPGRVRRHSDALRQVQDREESLRADLGQALERDELHLVFQPVVDLALHRTVSVEALLRWTHPVYGEVSPAEFVPLAEESALITEVGRWVLLAATAAVAAQPCPDLSVAVNVSARHVRSGELVDDVLAALEASGLPAARLVLEITESVLLDDGHVVADLDLLRRLGVRIAVDDFGTGWSSLAYLVGLPIDVLKMDRQFLADVESSPQRRALCASVLHLGTSLGLAVIVEGVETHAELRLLRDMGHRFIQGFLLSRPLPADVLARQLTGDGTDVPAARAVPEPDALPAVAVTPGVQP